MRMIRLAVLGVVAGLVGGQGMRAVAQPDHAGKPRLVITADPELDDNNTIIRAMMYTTDFDVEGLVYASSGVHWRGDGKGDTQYIAGREYVRMERCLQGCSSWRWPAPEDEKFIDRIVDAYAKAYPNLKVHNAAYPTPAYLRSKIKWGNVDFDGDYSHDSDGSNLIKGLLLDSKPGRVFVTAQGGQSTIARALKSIYDQYHTTAQWNAVREKVSKKLVIVPFGDQDGTYARYIKPNWPDVENWQLAMINFGYGIRGGLAPEDAVYVSGAWTRENILDRGALGALYRVWGDGKVMVEDDPTDYFGIQGLTMDELRARGYAPFAVPQEKDSFISEGDTPTYMNLLDNGLRAYENGRWGGWGGIWRGAQPPRAGATPPKVNGPDDPGVGPGVSPAGVMNPYSPSVTKVAPPAAAAGNGFGNFARQAPSTETARVNARFYAAAQNDFAARLKWAVTPSYKDANHEPKVKVKGPLNVSAAAGSTVSLEGEASDPDHNAVTTTWWQYRDAGTYAGTAAISDPAALAAKVTVPADAKPGDTIHIVLEGKDDGTPSLTSYQRVVITVK